MNERAPEPSAAATVILMRPSADGPEVLLTQRPASMAFAANMFVFPGGRVDVADADPRLAARSARTAPAAADAFGGNVDDGTALALHHAALRELVEEAGVLLGTEPVAAADAAAVQARLLGGMGLADALDGLRLTLATDRLAPIAHWTTPGFMPRRFSTWFFVADLPPGAEPVFAPDEVVGHIWLTPDAALDQLAAAEIAMWVPTTSALERLMETGATNAADVRARLPMTSTSAPSFLEESPTLVRFAFGAAGGLPGRIGASTLHGDRELVLVDPGDPSDAALGAIEAAVTRRGGRITAIVLTSTDPDHAAGAEALAIPLEVPILVAPGAGRRLPYAVREVSDGERLPSDIDLRVALGPAGSGRLSVVAGSARE